MAKLGEDNPDPFARRQSHTVVPADLTGPLQRAMAEYFLQFSAEPNSLYVRLAYRIRWKDWLGALITLNYERLLEQALQIAEVPAECVQPGENKTGLLEVCFPHGCCNFFVEGFNIGAGVVFVGFTNSIEGQVVHLFDSDQIRKRLSENQTPVMCYFEPRKRSLSGQKFLLSQQKRFADIVAAAENIAIIGAHFRAHDEHIWKPLEQTRARLIYCSGTDNDEIEKWVSNTRVGKGDLILSGYFKENYKTIVRSVGL